VWDDERDAEVRREAMAWLTMRSDDGREPVPTEDLRNFAFRGERLPLLDVQRGIRKPAVLPAALSIRTVYTPAGRQRPYEDAPGPDGMLRYKWRGDDADHAENRALREAMRREVPLIWFFGVGSALYLPVFPVYILAEEPLKQQFVVDPNVGHGLVAAGSVVDEHLRRYIVTQTRRRLHQPVFRAQVMRAYGTRGAVCALRHGQLLDAAHIAPDASEAGIAAVRNGPLQDPPRRVRREHPGHQSRPRRGHPGGPAARDRRPDAAARVAGKARGTAARRADEPCRASRPRARSGALRSVSVGRVAARLDVCRR
jgi:putative restriction endonuclease